MADSHNNSHGGGSPWDIAKKMSAIAVGLLALGLVVFYIVIPGMVEGLVAFARAWAEAKNILGRSTPLFNEGGGAWWAILALAILAIGGAVAATLSLFQKARGQNGGTGGTGTTSGPTAGH